MVYCCLILFLVYFSIQAINLFIISVKRFDQLPDRPNSELPTVAVLVAARNEAAHLSYCLQALTTLDYPAHLLEIWVGNDQSEDETERIIDQFTQQFPIVKKLNITGNIGSAKGKANVLAQLAHQSKASIFLITDADIVVHPKWAKTMIGFFNEHTGIVSGTTVVDAKGYLQPMQQIDWLYFMGLLLSFNRIGIPSTAVGNNMAIKREAYLSTGGYENMPFSVTEDYKLFKVVRDKGWQTINMLHPHAINISAPAANFNTLINQRKRWLTGAKELPIYWWFIFGVFGLFLPCFCFMLFTHPVIAVWAYGIKLGLQSITISIQQKQLKLNRTFANLIYYEVYSWFITLLTIIYFLSPQKLNWKNRYY